MDKLQKTKYENLIIEIITQNERYKGNEDLLKFIYDDVLTRLGGILESISDESVVRSYIERIVKLSVITTVKKRSLLLSSPVSEPSKTTEKRSAGYYDALKYQPSTTDVKININTKQAEKLKSEIVALAEKYPQKDFIKLYNLRFAEHKSLETISDELNVSQAQAAERLYELAALAKRIFGNEVS